MGSIEWIDSAVTRFGSAEFTHLVDQEKAIRNAREGLLEISAPATSIPAFVADLPSLFTWFGENYRDFPWGDRDRHQGDELQGDPVRLDGQEVTT